jgi:hypothetical protein
MEQVKVILSAAIIGYLVSVPFYKLTWLNDYTIWIGVAVLVVFGFLGAVAISWLDPKLSALGVLRLSCLFVATSITFTTKPAADSDSLNGPLQQLIVYTLAAGIAWILALVTPFVTTQINGDFAAITRDCATLFENMIAQLKLTKQDSLEDDPTILEFTDEQNLLEYDVMRRTEEKRVRKLEKHVSNRMKVILAIIGEAKMELWTDSQLVGNHLVIHKDLDRLTRDFFQMRIALETGFIPRLSYLTIQPLLPNLRDLEASVHTYISTIESSLINMFDVSHHNRLSGRMLELSKLPPRSPPTSDNEDSTMMSESTPYKFRTSESCDSLDELDIPRKRPLIKGPTLVESETVPLSRQIATIAQRISKEYKSKLGVLLAHGEMRISPTAELTRLNFFLWRIAELRKRLKTLERAVNSQVRHARTLGWGWYIKTHFVALAVPFIGLFQGALALIYMAVAMLVRFGLWIMHPCCCKTVSWDDIPIFGGRVKHINVAQGLASKDPLPDPPANQDPFMSANQHLSDLEVGEMTSGEEAADEIVVELPEPSLANKGNFRIGQSVKYSNTFFKDWINSGGWKYPVRFALALLISATAALAFQIYVIPTSRTSWLCVTVLIVITPSLGATLKRAIHRSMGTILGAVLAELTILFGSATHQYLVLGPAVVVIFISTYIQHSHYKPKPYSWTVTSFTYLLILFMSWPYNDSSKTYALLALYRMIQVLIGCVVVVLVALIFPERATDSLHQKLLSQSQKTMHAFIEMMATANSAIQETGKISKLVEEAHELKYPCADLLKLAKAELKFVSPKHRHTLVKVTHQLELITETLSQMYDTLRAGFSPAIRDWAVPFSDLLTRCVLFIEEDALLVYSWLSTRNYSFRPEPTRIASLLAELDMLFLKLRLENPAIHQLYPELFRYSAFVHTTRAFIVNFNNLVYYVTQSEQHNQPIHLYSR